MASEAVDVSTLLALRELQRPGQPDVVARIVSRFLSETDERLDALRAAVSAGDAASIERAAHALKGIAGTVGANEIMLLAKQLEDIGRSGSTQGGAALLSDLERAVARARPIFEGLCA